MVGRKVLLMVVLVCIVCLCGCQNKCVTKTDKVYFPIIVSAKTDRVCHDDGTLDVHKKGRVCILSYWDNNRTYDADGVLVKSDDKSGFWPLYHANSSKTENRKTSSGQILLFFKYNNERDTY